MSVYRKELQRQRVDCKAHIDIASRLMYITINMDDYLGPMNRSPLNSVSCCAPYGSRIRVIGILKAGYYLVYLLAEHLRLAVYHHGFMARIFDAGFDAFDDAV